MNGPGWPPPDEARARAAELLADKPRRLAHVLAVGRHGEAIARRAGLRRPTRDLAVAAAYLHDVGYAEPLRRTGFHPIDGATYLRAQGWEEAARIVARHSFARLQAGPQTPILRTFRPRPGIAQDLVDYADLRTGPDGRLLSVETRLAEKLARHGPDSRQARAMARERPLIAALVARVERRCGGDPLASAPPEAHAGVR